MARRAKPEAPQTADTGVGGKIRVDKWLWYIRLVKTRSLAQALIKSGKVRVNSNRISSPSVSVGPSDVLTVTMERRIRVLKVVAPGTRRGPATEAQTLYVDLSEPVQKALPVEQPARPALREEGSGRPTKKERRELDRFRRGHEGEY